MGVLFLDSSAIVKRYIAETGSQWMSDLMAPGSQNDLYIAVVAGAEVVAAIARRVRTGSIPKEQGLRAIAEFRDDWNSLYELLTVDRVLVNRAMNLAESHGLRGYDAIQLATALEVNAISEQFHSRLVFIAADAVLNAAAAAEGLLVENPNQHP